MRILQTRRDFMASLAMSGLAPLVAGDVAHAECRRRRGLVILSEFSDLRLRIDQDFAAERFRDLDRYVREMSYGQDCLDIRLSGWHRLPAPITAYAISPVNLKVDKSRVVKLIQDSIDAADPSEDFSRYDFVAIFMRARFVDYGMVGLCGYPGMLGWQSEVPFRTKSGQAVPGGVAIFTASAHLGTLFHDCAHVWGGVRDGKRVVPCLYDHDLQVLYPTIDKGWANALINMGFWDPMSCHSYKRELPPPGASSWTKLRLGWLPENKVKVIDPDRGATDVLLGPLADGDAETLAVRIPLSPTRYVLIENRQPFGDYDLHLPGHGVLVMMADDEIGECRHGKAPVRLVDADPSKPYLTGAAFNLPDRPLLEDNANGLRIELLEKDGMAYRIRIERLA